MLAGVAVSFGSRLTEMDLSLVEISIRGRTTVRPAAVVMSGLITRIRPRNGAVPAQTTSCMSDGGREKRGHFGNIGTVSARSHQGRAFLCCQKGFYGTARSSQGRAVVRRGEANP